jgi:hypothetical protein
MERVGSSIPRVMQLAGLHGHGCKYTRRSAKRSETDKLEEVNGCHKLEGLLKHRRCVQPRSTAPPAPLAAASMMARMHRPWFLFIVVVLVVLKARSTCTADVHTVCGTESGGAAALPPHGC